MDSQKRPSKLVKFRSTNPVTVKQPYLLQVIRINNHNTK